METNNGIQINAQRLRYSTVKNALLNISSTPLIQAMLDCTAHYKFMYVCTYVCVYVSETTS